MKKVIFVGGTAFSGSTFFHMMLANDPHGLAIGASRWLFQPQRPDHISQFERAPAALKEVWQKLREAGSGRLYETLFTLFPDVNFIVDSSKHPWWIHTQDKKLRAKGIDTRHVLIWKTPLELAASYRKRNRGDRWQQDWLNYHQLYFSVVRNWRAVRYRHLAEDENVLAHVCDGIGIPYFAQKHEYWQKAHYSFGGNYSARFHLYEEQVAKQDYLDKTFDKERMHLYRKIYYTPVQDEALRQRVEAVTRRDDFVQILALLRKRDVGRGADVRTAVPQKPLSSVALQISYMKMQARTAVSYLRYGRLLNRG